MIILGIDPGYAIVGYGIIKKEGNSFLPIDYGAITTNKELPFPERLLEIKKGMMLLIEKYQPNAIAVEELFFTTNQKTAILVAEARGVILVTAREKLIDLFEYTPLQIKQAMTGYGRATKQQIQQMVKTMLGLVSIPKPDDAADALAVALTHSQTNRFGKMFTIK